eukprot:COSAG02_NODE_818_length_16813_cov_137.642874_8_plen_101_part_00
MAWWRAPLRVWHIYIYMVESSPGRLKKAFPPAVRTEPVPVSSALGISSEAAGREHREQQESSESGESTGERREQESKGERREQREQRGGRERARESRQQI